MSRFNGVDGLHGVQLHCCMRCQKKYEEMVFYDSLPRSYAQAGQIVRHNHQARPSKVVALSPSCCGKTWHIRISIESPFRRCHPESCFFIADGR